MSLRGELNMARFKENEGTWMDLVEGKPEMGSICLKELTLKEIEEIDKICIQTKKKAVRGILYDKITEKKALSRRMRMEKAIVDWKGIYLDDEKEEAECNEENRVRIMRSIDFLKILAVLFDKLFDSNEALDEDEALGEDEKEKEDRAKNLKTTSDGLEPTPVKK